MNREACQATVHGVTRAGHDLAPKLPPGMVPTSPEHWQAYSLPLCHWEHATLALVLVNFSGRGLVLDKSISFPTTSWQGPHLLCQLFALL